MSFLSVTCCALLSAVCAFALVSSTGCGADPKGVDDCREIENARCEAAKTCGILGDTSVDECKRYYRDQCLHGLPVAQPGNTAREACVATIRAAGECAAASGIEVALNECVGVTESAPGVATACALVNAPEKATECSFLTPDVEPPTGEGGASGSGSEDTGGTGGT